MAYISNIYSDISFHQRYYVNLMTYFIAICHTNLWSGVQFRTSANANGYALVSANLIADVRKSIRGNIGDVK